MKLLAKVNREFNASSTWADLLGIFEDGRKKKFLLLIIFKREGKRVEKLVLNEVETNWVLQYLQQQER